MTIIVMLSGTVLLISILKVNYSLFFLFLLDPRNTFEDSTLRTTALGTDVEINLCQYIITIGILCATAPYKTIKFISSKFSCDGVELGKKKMRTRC